MTKYFLEIFETQDEIKSLKNQIETSSLKEAQDLKSATTLLSNESLRIHICKHGDSENGNNIPCEIIL